MSGLAVPPLLPERANDGAMTDQWLANDGPMAGQ